MKFGNVASKRGESVLNVVSGITFSSVGEYLEDGLTSCSRIALHSGLDKNAAAASGCILISIDNIVRAHESLFKVGVGFGGVLSKDAHLLDAGEPTCSSDAPAADPDRFGLTLSSTVL